MTDYMQARVRILVTKQILPVWKSWKQAAEAQKLEAQRHGKDANDARLAAIDKGGVSKGGAALCKFLPKLWDQDIQEMFATLEVRW